MTTLKEKMTASSVRGRIFVTGEDGERIGQWGGTECFLSRQTGIGPCLVVRSSRHKRYEGTFFRLVGLQRVLSTYAVEGKLTVVVPHEKRVCTVFIETTADVDALRMMAGLLQDRSHWRDMEKNVACRKGRQGGRGSKTKGQNLRDPGACEVPEWDYHDNNYYNDDGDSDYNVEEENNDNSNNNNNNNNNNNDFAGNGKNVLTVASMQKESESALPSSSIASAESQMLKTSSWGSAPSANAAASPNVSWTTEQLRAIKLVRSGRNVFITGSAGTGKTAWLLHLLGHVLSGSDGVVATATTGVAARIIGGVTLHSFAGIGRGDGSFEKIIHRVKSRPDVVRGWQQCKTLIIDEIGVLPVNVFTLLDEIARHVRSVPGKPFGGIQLVLIGDFLQLPPVTSPPSTTTTTVNNDSKAQESKWCFECPLWEKLQLASVEFRRNYRHEGDPLFAACMEDIRYGRYTRRVEELLTSCHNRQPGERFGVEPTVIMARRQRASNYNTERLQLLESVYFHRYASEDYASTPGYDLDKEVSLPSLLELRVGAQVVLLASLPDTPHLSNGDLGVVVAFAEQARGGSLPVVCFASSSGEEVVVPRVRMDVVGADGRVAATRTQVPLQLAWALTVHRVQGMTLPMARVELDGSFFECGQAYVALTRVRRREDLTLAEWDAAAIRADEKVVAFYERLFPRGPQLSLLSVVGGGVGDGSELVEVKKTSKRPRTEVSSFAATTTDTSAKKQRGDNDVDRHLLDHQVGAPTMTQNALKLLAAASSAIPQLTQESDCDGIAASQDGLQSFFQHSLLMDDE